MPTKNSRLEEYPITYLGYILGYLSIFVDSIQFFLHACLCRCLGFLLPNIFQYAPSCPATPTRPSVVLITGASAGIGRDVALDLAKRGYTVVAGVRKTQDGAAIEGAFYDWKSQQPTSSKTNGKLFPVTLDITNSTHIENAAQTVYRHCSSNNLPFVALINNAGYPVHGPFELLNMTSIVQNYETNVFGTLAVTKKLLPLLRSKATNGCGRIINLGSMTGKNAILPQLGSYASTKAAIRVMTQTLQLELFGLGIFVSLLEPGTVVSRSIMALNTAGVSAITGPDFEPPTILDDGNKYTQAEVLDFYNGQGGLHSKQYDTGAAAQPTWVVTNQIIHAIESNYPFTEYLAGFDAKLGDFVMRLLGPNIIKIGFKGVRIPANPTSQHDE
ncbi:hypothetical protein BGW37DRAFT_495116 [Umbelopsis sp. PMI_123]|nr:hypothetical protein BGW37DRAFT_495116 [Umbelopsis sp. PMI_123]